MAFIALQQNAPSPARITNADTFFVESKLSPATTKPTAESPLSSSEYDSDEYEDFDLESDATDTGTDTGSSQRRCGRIL